MKTLILAPLVSLTAAPAVAAESAVEMLNSKNGENLVFSEKFTKVTKGDTVTFKATKPGHNVYSGRVLSLLVVGASVLGGSAVLLIQTLLSRYILPSVPSRGW